MQDRSVGVFGLLLTLVAIWMLVIFIGFIIGFILYSAAVYYSGRHLWIRLTQRYWLTSKSALALVGTGFVMLTLSLLIPRLIFLWILLFLGVAILIIELWALAKCWPYWRDIYRQRRQIRAYSHQLREVTKELSRLSRRIQSLEARYGQPLREQAELERIVQALCRRDVENLTLRCRRWQEEFRQLSNKELRNQKRAALAQAKVQKTVEEQILFILKAGLLHLEELERSVGEKSKALLRNQRILERKAQEEQELRQKTAAAQVKLAQLEASYKGFRASRIVLD